MTLADDMSLILATIDSGKDHRIAGRTKLQKITYFCGYYGWDMGDYRLHRYGPFSYNLAELVHEECNLGMVEENDETPRIITLTDKGREFLKADTPPVAKNISKLVRYLSGWHRNDLELVATMDHVNRINDLTKEELIDKVKYIKNRFSPEEVADSYDKWLEVISFIEKDLGHPVEK